MIYRKPPAIKRPAIKRLAFILCLAALAVSGCRQEIDGMVLVPAGYFIMGTDQTDAAGRALALGLDKPWFADESPRLSLYQSAFYIDTHEVTNRQYYVFCQATDCRPPAGWRNWKYPEGQGDLPVTNVSFFDAMAYAQWMGKRLPTEREWEKAARGPEGSLYPWGDTMHFSAANVSRSPRKKKGQGLKPVGSHPAGASYYGVQDMIGNVWEWVWDYYQPYPGNEFKSAAYGKKYVVVRGLSYYGVGHFPRKQYKQVVALKARAAYREKLPPLTRKPDVGFRCAKDKDPLFKRLYEAVFS